MDIHPQVCRHPQAEYLDNSSVALTEVFSADFRLTTSARLQSPSQGKASQAQCK